MSIKDIEWKTPEEFFRICDMHDMHPKAFKALQDFVKEHFDIDMTAVNCIQVYRIYKMEYKLARERVRFQRTIT